MSALIPIAEVFPSWLVWPSQWPLQGDLLHRASDMGPAVATAFVIMGIIYLLFGVQIYKPLMAINACLFGAYIGACLGNKADSALTGAIIGSLVAGLVAWPMLKYAVAVMGGLCGAGIGSSVWLTIGQDPRFAWAGALIGLAVLGMLSFILFRGSIILFMSVQGATMLVFGVLSLAYKYPAMAQSMGSTFKSQPLLLPIAIALPMICGLIFQQTKYGGKSDAPSSKKPSTN